MKVLIVGYGSPIRGDDALGPLAADRLAADPPPEVSVIARHILTAELIPQVLEHERVIFLDAAVTGEPGEARCQRLEPDGSRLSSMAHFLDPRELLAWCEGLHGHAPEAWLITGTGADFGYSHYQLSASGERALESMLDQVRHLLS